MTLRATACSRSPLRRSSASWLRRCGGDNKEEAEAERRRGARSPAAPTRSTAIRSFPRTSRRPPSSSSPQSTQEGPTRVVIGYWESGLDEAYREWKDQVEEAGFNVTFDELEDKDSEVAYEGSGRTGHHPAQRQV